MKFISLTAHDFNLLSPDVLVEEIQVKGRPTLVYRGENIKQDIILTIKGSGVVPQVSDVEPTQEFLLSDDGIKVPLSKVSGKQITNLPEPQEGVAYIVSSFTQSAAKDLGRVDVYAPADIISTLNPDGTTTIVGTRGLKQ